MSPNGVLALSAPPPEPIHPSHSAIWPMSYVMASTVAKTADQNPTALVDGDVTAIMVALLLRGATILIQSPTAFSRRKGVPLVRQHLTLRQRASVFRRH